MNEDSLKTLLREQGTKSDSAPDPAHEYALRRALLNSDFFSPSAMTRIAHRMRGWQLVSMPVAVSSLCVGVVLAFGVAGQPGGPAAGVPEPKFVTGNTRASLAEQAQQARLGYFRLDDNGAPVYRPEADDDQSPEALYRPDVILKLIKQ